MLGVYNTCHSQPLSWILKNEWKFTGWSGREYRILRGGHFGNVKDIFKALEISIIKCMLDAEIKLKRQVAERLDQKLLPRVIDVKTKEITSHRRALWSAKWGVNSLSSSSSCCLLYPLHLPWSLTTLVHPSHFASHQQYPWCFFNEQH